ncbi:MAG: hypothetical protein O9323_19025 [Microcystis sp. LE19-131.1A]|jgi:hypothetical protein|nr:MULTISPECIES: hypothetical protein [Microcystis]MCZ8243789.1 hypothetical protein [Microcystis sp. LE19-131.1A]MDB9397282.1 hypothetical protein [Microcystis aeruginosa CS-573]
MALGGAEGDGKGVEEIAAILILMLEADFSTPTKNVITLIMTE